MTSTALFRESAAHLGKSARTRARLMDAAVELFARDGFEAASVNEIARLAEVANGTFYVHFRDKEEIGVTVALAIAEGVARQLDEAMVGVEDAIARTSMASRRFIDLASSEPDWGRALLRALWTFPGIRDRVASYLRADLQLGVDQGLFTATVDDILIDAFASMLMSGLFGRLASGFGPDAGPRIAELQLRMLGVAPDVAKAAAWRDLPPVALRLEPAPPER